MIVIRVYLNCSNCIATQSRVNRVTARYRLPKYVVCVHTCIRWKNATESHRLVFLYFSASFRQYKPIGECSKYPTDAME